MIARKLHERIPALTIEKELEEAQEDLNITLSEQQKEAVRMVFANPICIITGGPGTGQNNGFEGHFVYLSEKMRE